MLQPESNSLIPARQGSRKIFCSSTILYPGPRLLYRTHPFSGSFCPYTQACLWAREAVASVLQDLNQGYQPAARVGCAPTRLYRVSNFGLICPPDASLPKGPQDFCILAFPGVCGRKCVYKLFLMNRLHASFLLSLKSIVTNLAHHFFFLSSF